MKKCNEVKELYVVELTELMIPDPTSQIMPDHSSNHLKRLQDITNNEEILQKKLRIQEENDIIISIMKTTPALQLPREKSDIISAKSTDTIRHIFKKLISNKILSAPIYDKEVENWLGFIDLRDILASVVNLDKENVIIDDNIPLLGHKSLFLSQDPSFIIDMSKRNPFIPLLKNASIYDALKILVVENVHRIPILDDETGSILEIVSQSLVLKFLYLNIG